MNAVYMLGIITNRGMREKFIQFFMLRYYNKELWLRIMLRYYNKELYQQEAL